MAYAENRRLMVERQLIARGIRDERVLAAMGHVPRECFVEADQVAAAYSDKALPIAEGQAISQPFMVGAMSAALRLNGVESVLEIGTGSGYQAAVLGYMARSVLTIERKGFLATRARERLDGLGLTNIEVIVSDGSLGCATRGPFDAILVTAEAPRLPEVLVSQLIEGGRLVIPVAAKDGADLVRIVRTGERTWRQEVLMKCFFVPLVGLGGYQEPSQM